MKMLLSTLILVCATSVALAQGPAKRGQGKNSQGKSAHVTPAAVEKPLTPNELAVAERVYVGRLPCELGQVVTITADAQSPGYFDLQLKKAKFRMFAVESKSGAVRLESLTGDAVWLQLSNKSMLVNSKLGQRMADVCTSPEQLLVAKAFETSPPPNLLGDPEPSAPPTKP
jgi:hypothetical protein